MHKQVWPPWALLPLPSAPLSVGPVLPGHTQSWDPCEPQGKTEKQGWPGQDVAGAELCQYHWAGTHQGASFRDPKDPHRCARRALG